MRCEENKYIFFKACNEYLYSCLILSGKWLPTKFLSFFSNEPISICSEKDIYVNKFSISQDSLRGILVALVFSSAYRIANSIVVIKPPLMLEFSGISLITPLIVKSYSVFLILIFRVCPIGLIFPKNFSALDFEITIEYGSVKSDSGGPCNIFKENNLNMSFSALRRSLILI